MRPDDERYFAQIEDRLDEAWDVAEAAKEQGHDPKPKIEIPIARDMADRVENILGIDGVAERPRVGRRDVPRGGGPRTRHRLRRGDRRRLRLPGRQGRRRGPDRGRAAHRGGRRRADRGDRPGRAAGKRRRHRIRQRLLRRSDPVCGRDRAGAVRARRRLRPIVARHRRVQAARRRGRALRRGDLVVRQGDRPPVLAEGQGVEVHRTAHARHARRGSDGRRGGLRVPRSGTRRHQLRARRDVSRGRRRDRAEGPEDPAVHPRPRRGRLAVAARSDRRNDRQGRRRRERRGSRECRRRGRRRQRGHRGQRERRGRRG